MVLTPDVIIPARMGSSRFFGKPLVPIDGVPLVVRVCQRASSVFEKEKIFVATESRQISEVVKEYGFQVVMTSDNFATGTDRVAHASRELQSEHVINLQGDEPLVRAEHLIQVLEAAKKYPDVTHNCFTRLESVSEMQSRNAPKVVMGANGQLLYASRAPIPMAKSNDRKALGHKQVCIYYFPAADLQLFGEGRSKTKLESIEDIEILRLIENSRVVQMHELTGRFQAVDEPGDVKKVEGLLALGF